jgi:hypothetical protein
MGGPLRPKRTGLTHTLPFHHYLRDGYFCQQRQGIDKPFVMTYTIPMRDIENVLAERDLRSLIGSLISLDKDTIVIDYLNQEGKLVLFYELLREYPLTKKMTRVQKTAVLYGLVKALGISRPRQVLAEVLGSIPNNINQRIENAKKKGFLDNHVPSYQEAKQRYIAAYSA